MRWKAACMATGGAIAALAWTAPAQAQASGGDLMSLDGQSLKSEIQSRYDEALGLTRDTTVVSANSDRFTWASQAKVQCGIALGFLKSSTKDPVSIGKCQDAANRMRVVAPQTVMAPPAPAALPEACSQPMAGIVFFEFDSAVPPESAGQTLDSVVNYTNVCHWTGLVVTGHTDRSGSDAYNQALSVRRAQAIGALLEAKGVPSGIVTVSGKGETEPKVPTMDGERNPTNRRVEITVK